MVFVLNYKFIRSLLNSRPYVNKRYKDKRLSASKMVTGWLTLVTCTSQKSAKIVYFDLYYSVTKRKEGHGPGVGSSHQELIY